MTDSWQPRIYGAIWQIDQKIPISSLCSGRNFTHSPFPLPQGNRDQQGSPPKQDLDPFSRYRAAQVRDRQTGRQTHTPCHGLIDLMRSVRPNNSKAAVNGWR